MFEILLYAGSIVYRLFQLEFRSKTESETIRNSNIADILEYIATRRQPIFSIIIHATIFGFRARTRIQNAPTRKTRAFLELTNAMKHEHNSSYFRIMCTHCVRVPKSKNALKHDLLTETIRFYWIHHSPQKRELIIGTQSCSGKNHNATFSGDNTNTFIPHRPHRMAIVD